jgi:hypothetical protein
MSELTTEQIWVTTKEAAEVAGYTPAWLNVWGRDLLLQPQSERLIQVRNDGSGYEFWLPDLVDYIAQYAVGRLNAEVKEIWVNTSEGAEMTGYHRDYVQRLARENWNLNEDQRIIQIRQRAGRYELWLPDLFKYISEHGYGPIQKKRVK